MNMNSRSSLPPLGRSSVLPFQPNRSYSTKPKQPASPNFRPIGPECSSKQDHKMSSHASPFSSEISRMSDNPPKNLAHRRTHSDVLTLLNDVSFDGTDLGIVGELDGFSCFDETEEDLLPEYLDWMVPIRYPRIVLCQWKICQLLQQRQLLHMYNIIGLCRNRDAKARFRKTIFS